MDSTKIAFSRECRRRSARDADARPFHTAWALRVIRGDANNSLALGAKRTFIQRGALTEPDL